MTGEDPAFTKEAGGPSEHSNIRVEVWSRGVQNEATSVDKL